MRTGFGRAGIWLCLTRSGASAGSGPTGGAAHAAARDGRKVAILAPSCAKSRFQHRRARRARVGLGNIDVGSCPTHPGARAGSEAAGGAARMIACGAAKVGDFAILPRTLGGSEIVISR